MSAERAGAVREETVKSGDRGIFVRSWAPSDARAVVVIVHGFNSHSGYYVWVGETARRRAASRSTRSTCAAAASPTASASTSRRSPDYVSDVDDDS